MENITNKDVMNLFNNTELSIGLLEILEKLALSILEEPINIKNQMAMKGILFEVNDVLNKHIYVKKLLLNGMKNFSQYLINGTKKIKTLQKRKLYLIILIYCMKI